MLVTSRWSGAEWFYLSKIDYEYEVQTSNNVQTLSKPIWKTFYYAACNTSARPHWYEERRRADTVHRADIKALIKDLKGENVWVWPKDEFDTKTKELITDAVFKDIE